MPSLQELLQDLEFDKFDLEQLAESLLEDVSSNLETNVPPSCATNAEDAGKEQHLSRPMVAVRRPDDEAMESPKDSCLKKAKKTKLIDVVKMEFDETYNKSRIIYADEIPVDEEDYLEIHDSSDDEVCLTLKSEPMDRLLSPIPSFEEDNLKSPIHTISDCGYESHGSPISHRDFSFNEQQDDLNYLLNDLFPALA